MGGPHGGLGEVGCPSWSSGKGQEALPKIWECSGIPPKHPEIQEWSKALPEVRDVSCVPPGGEGGVGKPSQRPGRGRMSLLRSGKGQEALPKVREGL